MFINPYSTYCHSPAQYHYNRRPAIVSKREHMFLATMSKAMRYYRVWIYSCNAALFAGTAIYLVAFLTVINDTRLNFFTGIHLYHPSFLYSYAAIILQGGLLQTIGCLGALKLNVSYLNAYLWTMFALIFGDGLVGIIWVVRYNDIVTNLKGDLKLQILNDYQRDLGLQSLWNDLQESVKCCGVDGPVDYNRSSWAKSYVQQLESSFVRVPLSCCPPEESTFGTPHNSCEIRSNDEHLFHKGCYESIYYWFQSSVDLLSVTGFCINTFVKMCFLCLLRHEIREMIDKINAIKGESKKGSIAGNVGHMLPFQDLEAYLPRPSMQQDTIYGSNYRPNSITEKCHCRIGLSSAGGTNLATSTFGESRMILSTSTANLSGCQSKKHSLV